MSAEFSRESLDAGLIEALHGEMVPKFLATLDADGKPNVVPIITLDAADPKTLVFGELFIWKTRNNLESNPNVSAVVVTEDLKVWTLRATFRHFEEKGPHVDLMNRKDLFRYNAYLGVRRAAIFDLEEVTGAWNLSKLNVAAELLPTRAWGIFSKRKGKRQLPPRVVEKFNRTQAIKVLAYRTQNGYPDAFPLFSLQSSGTNSLMFGTRIFKERLAALAPGTPVAVSVITMDPVAYQVKGVFEGTRMTPAGRVGSIRLEEAYSASPPLPGEPIVMESV